MHLFVFTVQCHIIRLPFKHTENRKRESLGMEKKKNRLSRINIITVGVIFFTVYEACGKAVTGLMCSGGHLESEA